MQKEAEDALDLIAEMQSYGESLIRMSEYTSSAPLSESQKEVLLNGDLDFLGLTLVPQLSEPPYLQASHVVGSARFAHDKKTVIVHVEPKIGNANFLRMLDHTSGLGRSSPRLTEVSVSQMSPVGLFLEFFAGQVQAFIQHSKYRSYSFATSITPNVVKGRPIVRDYFTKSLPHAMPHVLPCRYLDFSADVLENQIIVLAIHTAIQLTALLPPTAPLRVSLVRELRACLRLLPGVSIRRITVAEIRRIRYNRLNQHFKPIHHLCEVILRNCSISLKPGEKLPFVSFAINMPELFEAYTAAIFSLAFGRDFIGKKSQLRFMLDVIDKPIILDGLLRHLGRNVVVECKYKDIGQQDGTHFGENDYVLLGGRIRSADLYQATAYSSHIHIRASASVLVYPTWENNVPVTISGPIEAFGWRQHAEYGIPIYLLGLNLASSFENVVQMLRNLISNIVSS